MGMKYIYYLMREHPEQTIILVDKDLIVLQGPWPGSINPYLASKKIRPLKDIVEFDFQESSIGIYGTIRTDLSGYSGRSLYSNNLTYFNIKRGAREYELLNLSP